MMSRPWGEIVKFAVLGLMVACLNVGAAVLLFREWRTVGGFGKREVLTPAEATLDDAHPARLVRLVDAHWRCDAAVSPSSAAARERGVANRIWVPIEEREGDMSSTRLFVLDIGTRECHPREVDGVLARDQGGFGATIPAYMGAYNGWDLPVLVVGAGPQTIWTRAAMFLGGDAFFVVLAWWRLRRRR